jgi:hypothetical protein
MDESIRHVACANLSRPGMKSGASFNSFTQARNRIQSWIYCEISAGGVV